MRRESAPRGKSAEWRFNQGKWSDVASTASRASSAYEDMNVLNEKQPSTSRPAVDKYATISVFFDATRKELVGELGDVEKCKEFLALIGPTYASRLWCVMECFAYCPSVILRVRQRQHERHDGNPAIPAKVSAEQCSAQVQIESL